MASQLDHFIEELKNGTAWVCQDLPKQGEMGETILDLLKSAAEFLSKQPKEENDH